VQVREASPQGQREKKQDYLRIDAENLFGRNIAAHVVRLMDPSPTLEQLVIDAGFTPPGLVAETAQNPSTSFPDTVERENGKGKCQTLSEDHLLR
jgi:hypothetical protein